MAHICYVGPEGAYDPRHSRAPVLTGPGTRQTCDEVGKMLQGLSTGIAQAFDDAVVIRHHERPTGPVLQLA
jgi:hypothetical protein